MNRAELQQAITETLEEIQGIKEQINQAPDPRGETMLRRRLKELQYLQLWHLEQLENLD